MSHIDYRREVTRVLESFGNLLQRINPWVFSIFLVVVMLLKDGVGFFYVFNPADVSSEFPLPLEGTNAGSFGWPLLAWALQLETYRGLWLIPLLVILTTALVFSPVLSRRFDRPTAFAIALVLLLGPIPMTLLSHLGRHDFLVVIGGVVLALSLRRPFLAVLTTLVMSSGNPEQSLVATVLLLLAVIALKLTHLRAAAAWATVVAAIYWLGVLLILRSLDRPSRLESLAAVVPDFTRITVQNLPVLVWATYGLSIFALLALITSLRGWNRIVLAGVTAVPILLYFLGDQSRIGVAAATPIIVLATVLVVRQLMESLNSQRRSIALASIAITALVLPTVHILYLGDIYAPYRFLVDILF